MKEFASSHKSLYAPDFVADSVLDIDFRYLAESGVSCVAVDVDSTIVPHGGIELDRQTRDFLVEQQQQGNIKKLALATNRTQKNLKPLAASIGAIIMQPQWYSERKPREAYFKKLLIKLDCQPEEALMVGDKVVYDVRGANKAGMKTVLVNPLGPDMLWDRLLLRRYRDRRHIRRLREE